MSCTLRQANYIFFLCLFPFPTSRLGKMKLWVVLQVVKFILFSSALFISYLKTPANLNVGVRISYCLCKFTTCHAPAAGKNYIFFLCLCPFPTSRLGKWNCGWWYRLSKFILFSSALFTSYLKTPADFNVGGRISYCLCKFATCHAPAAGKLHFLPLSLSFSHLKTRENEFVGGGIGCPNSFSSVLPFSPPTSKLRQISM